MAGRHDARRRSATGSRAGSAPRSRRAPAAPPEFDRLVHERMRLGILSALMVNERLSFNELKELLQTTDGNLSVHARKLEEGGYVSCHKHFAGRVPRTDYRITAAGRRALEEYLKEMEELIRVTRKIAD
jgi:DNA-binding MarR family transcriptional regulator